MGRRGPKKQAELALASTIPVGNARNIPKTIADDPEAVEIWDKSVEQLVKQGAFQDCDRAALERYCVFSVLVRKYAAMVLKSGGYQTTSTGYTAVSAEMTCFMKTSIELRALEKVLGLNPEARRAMNLATSESTDDLEDFLNEAG